MATSTDLGPGTDAPGWRRGALVRGAVVLVATVGWLLFAAPAALAHTVSGEGASNYATTVTGLSPSPPGIELSVVENGARLRLRVDAGLTVYVNGYEDDLYLRFDSTGVSRNLRSSATYLNDDRDGNTVAPPGAVDPTAPPSWEPLHGPTGGQTVALWHDHRAHWMGDAEPGVVRAAPDEFHQIYAWTIDLTVDGEPVVASGTLDWVPGPSPLPWAALALVCGLSVAFAGTRRRWGPPLAAATVAVVVADAVHSGLAAGARATDRLTGFLSGNVVEIALWLLGLAAAALLVRRSTAGLYLAASTGFVLALVGGLADVSVLYRSSAPAAGPLDLTRTATALTIGLGLGLVAAAGAAGRRGAGQGRPGRPATATTGGADIDTETDTETETGIDAGTGTDAGTDLSESGGASPVATSR